MDPTLFRQICDFLSEGRIPQTKETKTQQKKFKDFAEQFEFTDRLYKSKPNFRIVVQKHEFEPLMYLVHDDPIGGHLGINLTMSKLRERYFWPNMKKDVEFYIKSCYQCQRRQKPSTHNEMHAIVAKAPFERIGIDFVGPLPATSKGNRYILVAVDYFTKWPEAKATKRADAQTVVDFLYEEIICRHGPFRQLHSDRGTHFANALIKGLTEKFRIRHHLSSPYNPRANGQVERYNRTLCEALAKQTEGIEDWDMFLAPSLYSYRSAPLKATGITPFYLTYGRGTTWPNEETNGITLKERVETLMEELPIKRNEAHQKVKIGKEKMIANYSPKDPHQFKVGDKVWYYNAAKEKQYSDKLEPKMGEPMIIEDVLLNGSYRIGNHVGTLKTPINGDKLSRRYDRLNMEPIIVDLPPPPKVFKDRT